MSVLSSNVIDLTLDNEQDETAKAGNTSQANDTFTGVSVPPLTIPRWVYGDFKPPCQRSREYDALRLLDPDEDIVLDEFVVYRDIVPEERRPGFVALNDVATRQGGATFYFDGVLRAENPDSQSKFYLQRIPFSLVSIGGYEDVEQHSVGDDIWIQSSHCYRNKDDDDIWYRLGNPAPEYKPYQRLFGWVANLSKYLVDFLYNHSPVCLDDFESCLFDWLISFHGDDPGFMSWYNAYGKPDLRHAIVAHYPFLQKQAADINPSYLDHPFWSELGQAPHPVVKRQSTKMESTVVTPYVWKCFKNMPWSDHLKKVKLGTQYMQHQRRLREMGFVGTAPKAPAAKSVDGGHLSLPVPGTSFSVSPGDVIATWKDKESKWKGSDELWYALVQDIRVYKQRPAKLFVIWLYQPMDTVCANLTYPYSNELFLSDHCNCDTGNFDITQVVKKVPVSFASLREDGSEFFVRQTYHSVDETFTSLKDEHCVCSCRRMPSEPGYEIGDTVLVEGEGESDLKLEPAEIVGPPQDCKVEIRQLSRRNEQRPNELVYTQRIRSISLEQIQRPCHVRFYSEEDRNLGRIPPPYNRDGNGDAFYITSSEVQGRLEPAAQSPEGFKQGPDPLQQTTPSTKQLRGLNVFSGGGNFDRGLEEGMAVKSEWAVEWELLQMLTYRANHAATPDELKLYCGSVNDYLHKAIHGTTNTEDEKLVAQLGQVEFLSAGSPCQGYSLVNAQKHNVVSMRNSSMIASVAAFVDFYRPKYAILENVVAMAQRGHEQNPLSQLICAFVGMGYQLRLLNLDAWSFGAPQSRSRLFVVIAAPGLQLPAHPALTHSHPPTIARRSLGEAPNGLPFGERQWDTPVFDFVSAAESTKDLPPLGQAKVMSIPEPDHRPSRTESAFTQTILNRIPKYPRRMGLVHAFNRRWLSRDEFIGRGSSRQNMSISKWSRIHPRGFFPTITTSISPACRYTGRCLHWDQNRLITIKEARRAQGFPDSEIILGTPGQQWEIIGNSVARQVAVALGLTLRDACLRDGMSTPTCVPPPPSSSETETRSTTTTTTTATPNLDADADADTSDTSVSSDAPVPPTPVRRHKRGVQVLDEVVILTSSSSSSSSSTEEEDAHEAKRLKT